MKAHRKSAEESHLYVKRERLRRSSGVDDAELARPGRGLRDKSVVTPLNSVSTEDSVRVDARARSPTVEGQAEIAHREATTEVPNTA